MLHVEWRKRLEGERHFLAPSQCAKERHKASKSLSCVKEKAHDELVLHSMPKKRTAKHNDNI
jgi:hypothetical protein